MYDEVKFANKSAKWRPTTTFRQRASLSAQGGVREERKGSSEIGRVEENDLGENDANQPAERV